jgi:hypothetical protein
VIIRDRVYLPLSLFPLIGIYSLKYIGRKNFFPPSAGLKMDRQLKASFVIVRIQSITLFLSFSSIMKHIYSSIGLKNFADAIYSLSVYVIFRQLGLASLALAYIYVIDILIIHLPVDQRPSTLPTLCQQLKMSRKCHYAFQRVAGMLVTSSIRISQLWSRHRLIVVPSLRSACSFLQATISAHRLTTSSYTRTRPSNKARAI